MHSSLSTRLQALVGLSIVLVAIGLGFGAMGVSSVAGYGGVGPNFLPWVVSAALMACGAVCLLEVRTGGFRHLEPGSGAEHGHWGGFAWVSAGLLLDAALITHVGFILACALCFMLAARGFKNAEGRIHRGIRTWLRDLGIGVLVSAPVYWMFTKVLDIRLPGLTETGWL